MRLLVSGGAGYVGSGVAAHLLAAGHDVTVLDDLSTGYEGGTLALLDAMRLAGTRRIIFSSTAAVYGDPERTPIEETSPTRPASPYGASKLAVDTALTEFARLYGYGAVSLRYFNVAGAWQAPDGTCVRDYIHVTDLADAHLRALSACEPGRHRIYNLGNGAGFSVREVLDVCRQVTGRDIRVTVAPRRPGDPAVLVASARRIQSDLGWQARRDLRAMVAGAWQFAQLNFGQVRE
jgi:UDP-glucose 4-epimerase